MSEVKKANKMVILDGNEAAASVAYRLSEVVAIYPITPSSPMAEWARSDGARRARRNLGRSCPSWKNCKAKAAPQARSTVHCRPVRLPPRSPLRRASLLMIPNMYKIAGELTPRNACNRTHAGHACAVHLR